MKKGSASALRKGRYSEPGRYYHLIITTKERVPFFKDYHSAQVVVKTLQGTASTCRTISFVVMPDHIHWLMQLDAKHPLEKIVRFFKSSVTKKIGTPVWQHGFYDHAIRHEESLIDIARYIVMNPVRAGLCQSIREYPWWDCIYL